MRMRQIGVPFMTERELLEIEERANRSDIPKLVSEVRRLKSLLEQLVEKITRSQSKEWDEFWDELRGEVK